MQILEHFDTERTPDFTIYRLREADWSAFIGKLPNDFRLCYIEDAELTRRAADNRLSAADFLERYILPDEPTIKSGDFGEMLSFFAMKENYEKKGITLIAPRKWQWKDNRNKAAPCSDSVFFRIADTRKFTGKDMLITIESKMKAVKSNKHRIQEAIDGAIEDKLSRLVKTLNWLEEKYAKKGLAKERKMIERFKDPVKYGGYEKHHKAFAILDENFETEETVKAVNNAHGIKVVVFSIKELREAYEQTRTNLIRSV